jgi:hypothetical protein
MSIEENKVLLRRFTEEVINKKTLSLLEELTDTTLLHTRLWGISKVLRVTGNS